MERGLSLDYSVRGGRKIFFSQQLSHSLSYCQNSGDLQRHLFICLIMLNQQEEAEFRAATSIMIVGVTEEDRILPVYYVTVEPK